MRKIMFVCHGNICRSPMAEFVFKDMLEKAGRQNEFEVESSAVSSEEIDCSHKRARKLVASDAEKFDLFVCMDESNLRGAVRILGEQNARKCVKLMSYLNSSDDVSDPWYTRDFKTCYNDICRGLSAMLEKM